VFNENFAEGKIKLKTIFDISSSTVSNDSIKELRYFYEGKLNILKQESDEITNRNNDINNKNTVLKDNLNKLKDT